MIKTGLQRRKVKVFLLFLLCSFLAWLVSRLSETYTSRTTFQLAFSNIPDSLLLDTVSKDRLNARLRASGFQFLAFNFNAKRVDIDLSEVAQNQTGYFVSQEVYRKQIEKQLPGSMVLLEVDRDTLFIGFSKLFEKEVPVEPNIEINLGPNYLLEGELSIDPATVTVRGPKDEIAVIDKVTTLKMVLADLTDSFKTTAVLYKPDSLMNTVYSENSVSVSGTVFRFSEKIIEVPIEVINLPEGTAIKTFPDVVSVLCKARIEILKTVSQEDFKVVADYRKVADQNQFLRLSMTGQPEGLHSAQLLENEVEYILKRE